MSLVDMDVLPDVDLNVGVKFAAFFFQNVHDTLGSKCKHGVKEVANSVIVCMSIQADFLHITRLIVWCSSPKKRFLLGVIRRRLYELSSIATGQRACDKLHVDGFDGHHLAAKICNIRIGFIFLYYFSKCKLFAITKYTIK